MTQPYRKTIYEVLGRESVHPFPARMAPGIALKPISVARKRLRILDPMAGSGTVLAIAQSNGHDAVGIDIDPLAVLMAKVWTTPIDSERLKKKASLVLLRAKEMFDEMPVREAYPVAADDETRSFIRYWFDAYSRRQLASLARAIALVSDVEMRNALWCGFSRLIITKQSGASLGMDLSHSRPHRTFKTAPAKPFRHFLTAVDRVADNCLALNDKASGPPARVRRGDARKLPLLDSSFDLVLTSPPYLNAIDYMRCSKFSLVWMGYSISELRRLRSASIGAESSASKFWDKHAAQRILTNLNLKPSLASAHEAILARYIDDMHRSMYEVSRVLSTGGRAIYVIGENTIRGTYIPTASIVQAIARLCRLKLYQRHVRTLPANRRYLPPPSRKAANLGARMRQEIILGFRKRVSL